MPRPLGAEFSAFMMTASSSSSCLKAGTRSWAAVQPASPTTSPMNKRRNGIYPYFRHNPSSLGERTLEWLRSVYILSRCRPVLDCGLTHLLFGLRMSAPSTIRCLSYELFFRLLRTKDPVYLDSPVEP